MTKKEDILSYIEWKKSKCELDNFKFQNPIFVVFMIQNANKEMVLKNGKASGMPDFGCRESVGFYYELDSAIQALETNSCDIRECVYDAGFVLCVFPGLYESATQNQRMFFVWDDEKNGYVQSEEPSFFAHIAI